MVSILVSIAFVGAGAAVGGLAMWFVCHALPGRDARNPSPRAASHPITLETIAQLMSRLQELTTRVAADVVQHHSRVQAFSDELDGAEQEPLTVLAVVARIVEANEQMQARLKVVEDKLLAQAQEIEMHVTQARTDPLTKLGNRRAFDDEIGRCLKEFTTRATPATIMLLDVDFFKRFNDTYGHLAGDMILQNLARTLREVLPNQQIICRYGGEEFAILFPGLHVSQAVAAAERARQTIGASAVACDGRELRVTVSSGLAEFLPADSVETVVRRADQALYAAKAAGRNCGYWHTGHQIQRLGLPADAEAFQEKPRVLAAAPADPADPASALLPPPELTTCHQAFVESVSRRLAEWKRGGASLSLLFVRVDHLEKYRSGCHATVHEALERFLQASIRDMDHVVRFDLDTFALCMPTARLSDAIAAGERIRKAVERSEQRFPGIDERFTVSIGAAHVSHSDDATEFLTRGQAALEAALHGGGNRCVGLSVIPRMAEPETAAN